MGAPAAVLACAVAGALPTAGPATAASRGFRLHNNSRHALRLESATSVPRGCGPGSSSHHCVPTGSPAHYSMGFEGRPGNGAVLKPGGPPHVWELKYSFDLLNLVAIQWAAKLTYKIKGTDGTVQYVIATTPTTNDSECKVIPAHVGRCTGDGLKLTFSNP